MVEKGRDYTIKLLNARGPFTKGKLFIQEMVAKAKDPGYRWVEYYWKRHGEKQGTLKRAYTLGMPNENLYLAAGYYLD